MSLPYFSGAALTCAQARAVDQIALEQFGMSGLVLMENAGRNAAAAIYAELCARANVAREASQDSSLAGPVMILCGGGNNGGDGYVIARHLANARQPVVIVATLPPEQLRGDAAVNAYIAARMGIAIHRAEIGTAIEAAERALSSLCQSTDPVELGRRGAAAPRALVDALLGSGARGAPRAAAAELIRWANARSDALRIAIDIPSGLDADAGTAHDPTFRADLTLTFVAEKVGFASDAARPWLGRVLVLDIGVPEAATALACREA